MQKQASPIAIVIAVIVLVVVLVVIYKFTIGKKPVVKPSSGGQGIDATAPERMGQAQFYKGRKGAGAAGGPGGPPGGPAPSGPAPAGEAQGK